MYLWYCTHGKIIKTAKLKTQSVKCQALFRQQKKEGPTARSWLSQMQVDLGAQFEEKFGKPLKEFPADLLRQAKSKITGAILAALKDTANRNVSLNSFMSHRPYLRPATAFDRLTWAALHDERVTLSLTDEDVPEEFRQDVRRIYREQKWMGIEDQMQQLNVGSETADEEFDELIVSGNLEITMTYSCNYCATAASALTGWDVKPPTSNNVWRWGCLTCRKNWDRSTERAVVVHCRLRDLSFSFFTRWPLDREVLELWPEVYHKAIDLVVLRSTYYLKYDAFPELRDAPPSDNPRYRLDVSAEIQRKIWNIMLPDATFEGDKAKLAVKVKAENERRWRAYGPPVHWGSTGTETTDVVAGVGEYRNMRVSQYFKSLEVDADEYLAYMRKKDADKKKAQKRKRKAENDDGWVVVEDEEHDEERWGPEVD